MLYKYRPPTAIYSISLYTGWLLKIFFTFLANCCSLMLAELLQTPYISSWIFHHHHFLLLLLLPHHFLDSSVFHVKYTMIYDVYFCCVISVILCLAYFVVFSLHFSLCAQSVSIILVSLKIYLLSIRISIFFPLVLFLFKFSFGCFTLFRIPWACFNILLSIHNVWCILV